MRIKRKKIRIHPIPLAFGCICFIVFNFLVDYMKAQSGISILILFTILLCALLFTYSFAKFNKDNKVLNIFIVLSCIIEILRFYTYKDPNELLLVLLLSLIYLLIFNLRVRYQRIVLICTALAIFMTSIRSFRAMFAGNTTFAGNRVGIMISYFWCTLLVLLYQNRFLKYSVILLGLIQIMFTQSRTSLLAFCIACIFVFVDEYKGKLSLRKLVSLIICLIVVTIVLYLNANTLTKLIYGKWSTDNSSSSSLKTRLLFWRDIFSHRTFIGLQPNYMMKKYGVSNCHNGLIQAYLQSGIIGFIGYIICQVVILRDAFMSNSSCKYLIIFSFVLSIFESNFWFDQTYPLYPSILMACWGIIAAVKANEAVESGGYEELLQFVEGYSNLAYCMGIGPWVSVA